jgi:transmembrane sensor
VITKGQTVEVLGTHFNVNAYDDERSIKTTLLEGSVKISVDGHVAMLTPGEQAQVFQGKNSGSGINVVTDANTEEAVAWKNGFFQFDNTDLQAVMRQYSRWYDVKIIYEGEIKERFFSGQIHRNLNGAQALDLLNYADIHFRINGKTIVVSP